MAAKCPVCNGDLHAHNVVRVQSRGLRTVCEFSRKRNDEVASKLKDLEVADFHFHCYKDYTRRVKASEEHGQNTPRKPRSRSVPLREINTTPVLRSSLDNFRFDDACLFCADQITCQPGDQVRLDRYCASYVSRTDLKEKILKYCNLRSDQWGKVVSVRVNRSKNLVLDKARYHRQCYQSFQDPNRKEPKHKSSPFSSRPRDKSTGAFVTCPTKPSPTFKSPPARRMSIDTPSPVGRRTDSGKSKAFQELCKFITTSEDCQFTLPELVDEMERLGGQADVYVEKYIRRLLLDHFGDQILITDRTGNRPSILSFRGDTFHTINTQWYENRRKNEADEKLRIIHAAADIIRSDVMARQFECDVYPTVEDIRTGGIDTIPVSLQAFLSRLHAKGKKTPTMKTKRHLACIGNAIVASLRPCTYLSPLQIASGVHIHRSHISRALIDLLNSMGLCTSYSEVLLFEKAIVLTDTPITAITQAFTQYVFDNADFNIQTIDGHGTFHSMGGIVCVSPAPPKSHEIIIKRDGIRQAKLNYKDYASLPVRFWKRPEIPGLATVTVEDMSSESSVIKSLKYDIRNELQQARAFDNLWALGVCSDLEGIPAGWNGYMEVCLQGSKDYETTCVTPLPFVNLQPTNPSTIFTCLQFAAEQSQGQSFCLVTFDQPLFHKASDIVLGAAPDSILKSVIVCLGGFHTLMSFMGAIGHIMSGSGLEDLWGCVYATNSVNKMLSDGAYSRAVRAHFLSQLALVALMHRSVVLPDKQKLLSLCDRLFRKEESVNAILSFPETSSLIETMMTTFATHSCGRTGALWTSYVRMVETMRMFIRAARIGDLALHLSAVADMLPYFHASAHLHYAKSAHLYLQQMIRLKQTMPADKYDNLSKYFSIRRTDKLWAGIWSDMTIEQCLMRAMKVQGGLTTGRGMIDSTIGTWVKATPYCTMVTEAIEDFSGKKSKSSEQHVDLRDSRQSKDRKHLSTLEDWLLSHNPFEKPADLLVNLSTGVVADDYVNCDKSFDVGSAALKEMEGQNFSSIKLHRKSKVMPFSSMTKTVRLHNQPVQVQESQLFHRIVNIVKTEEQLESCFQYELAPRPPSLFDDTGMRKGTKSTLISAVEKITGSDTVVPVDSLYVLDGGHLLHRVVWPPISVFANIIAAYVAYAISHYTSHATVVFDGYDDSVVSTKSEEQSRRSMLNTCPVISYLSI